VSLFWTLQSLWEPEQTLFTLFVGVIVIIIDSELDIIKLDDIIIIIIIIIIYCW